MVLTPASVAAIVLWLACGPARADVKWTDPDTRPIPRPKTVEETLLWDILDHTVFYEVGDLLDLGWMARRVAGLAGYPARQADNVNALDEVPNSSWFLNRHHLRRMTPGALAAGPLMQQPDAGPWMIVAGKLEGKAPGFTIRDGKGDRYLVKFDARGAYEVATSAEVISTRIYHAAGYNVPPNAIVKFKPDVLRIGSEATVRGADGRERPMGDDDLDAILDQVEVGEDGSIRAVASKFLDGVPIGVFDFHDRRKDDANDRVDHQHRRELRGLRVLAAWLGDTDRRAANTLNVWMETSPGLGYVKHFLIDMGATLGSGTLGPTTPKSGHEYFVDPREVVKSLLSFGLYRKAWEEPVPMPFPEVGYFESETFHPTRWDPNYPNPAFLRCTNRDGYWGAKIVAAFTDADLEAIVRAAAFRREGAAAEMVRVLSERRSRTVRYWFARSCPADRFRIVGSRLVFVDLAEESGAPTRGYAVTFRDAAGRAIGRGERMTGRVLEVTVPEDLHKGTAVVKSVYSGKRVGVEVARGQDGRLRIIGVRRQE